MFTVQKYGYVLAMENVPIDAAWKQFGQEVAAMKNIAFTDSAKCRVEFLETLLENHKKNFPFRLFMGPLETYRRLGFLVNGPLLVDQVFQDRAHSLFAALLFRSADWWPFAEKLKDVLNSTTQVLNSQKKFKDLYFRFQKVDQTKLSDFLYSVNGLDKTQKIIDEQVIKTLLVVPDKEENRDVALLRSSIEKDITSILEKLVEDETFLNDKAKAEIDMLSKNISNVKTALEQNKDYKLRNEISNMVFTDDQTNQSTDLINSNPKLIYRFLKKGDLGNFSSYEIELQALLNVITRSKKDPFTCLSLLNNSLSNSESLLTSIKYFKEIKDITEKSMPLIRLLAKVSEDNRFIAWMQIEWNTLKEALNGALLVIRNAITGVGTSGTETDPSAVRFKNEGTLSVKNLAQKPVLLTFIIDAYERNDIDQIISVLQKLTTKVDSDNKLDLLESLLQVETAMNITTVDNAATLLPSSLQALQVNEFLQSKKAMVGPTPGDQKVVSGQGWVSADISDEANRDEQSQGAGRGQSGFRVGTGNGSSTGTPTPWLQWFWNGTVTFFAFLKNNLFWWW